MKYLIVVPDGAADDPVEKLDGKTPLEVADMPNITKLAQNGEVGLVKTIPVGVAPGSDAANLAVLGYNPATDLTGRSPLEAVSMGIDMTFDDVAFRTNIVTLQAPDGSFNADIPYEELTIIDHSAGDISNEEAAVLIEAIDQVLGSGDPNSVGDLKYYPGVSYRHALIAKGGLDTSDFKLNPPHDHLDKVIGEFLPSGNGTAFIYDMMKESYDILKDHPVNVARIAAGKNPANSIWIWGQGTKPQLESFTAKFDVTGSVISAVDLIKGIGICAGLESIDVAGVTGTIHTNYKGKADAAIEAFELGKDLAYIHVEAPDECSHQGQLEEKIEAMHLIDTKVIAPVIAYLDNTGDDYKVLIVPDHRTPVLMRTHTSEPVPFVVYDSRVQVRNEAHAFNEVSGATGNSY
ncbi:MAG: cofactor-independent phosphoglycerate mutase, partial [Clostridiales Family XIII bacterium]|nr:cofactor-independent phosphoglycerate mutase [Clostridiales Family XIII bacterium]